MRQQPSEQKAVADRGEVQQALANEGAHIEQHIGGGEEGHHLQRINRIDTQPIGSVHMQCCASRPWSTK